MGVHASPRRLKRELAATRAVASMPPLEKKRNLADFFKPSARTQSFQGAGNVVPQKRPSPSPDTENIPPPAIRLETTTTPRKSSSVFPARTPSRPDFSPIFSPRSGSLPIRTPPPKFALKPASVYQDARLFETKSSSLSRAQLQTPALNQDKTSPPEKRQTKLEFPSITSIPVSTQSVVRGGKRVVVRDSDEDDLDSLASLDEIFGTRRDDDTTSASSPPELEDAKIEEERIRTLSAFTYGRSEPLIGKDKLRSLLAKERSHRLDISQLINDHLDDEEEDQRIQKSREEYDQSLKILTSGQHGELDPKLLATLVQHTGGDDDDLARLIGAVSRTEALSTNKSFSFFRSPGIRDFADDASGDIDFPQVPVTSSLFRSYDDAGRTRAYLSGFMAEQSGAGKLPDEVLNWTFDSVLTEPDANLRQSYIECLSKGSSSWARTNVDAPKVEAMFLRLGADTHSLKSTVQPKYQSLESKKSPVMTYLTTALELFQAIGEHMDFVALTTLAGIVCRLMLDESLMSTATVCFRVEEVLQSLLGLSDREARDHVVDCILKDMSQHLEAPNLQAQLLSHIMPESLTSCDLRVRLAFSFLMGPDLKILRPEANASTILDDLTNYVIASTHFDTTSRAARSQNYSHLRARTQILDVAISDGHRPATFTSAADESAFNASADKLADALKAKYSSISDSGTSHLTRTEAKDTLTALYWRVLVAVRTKPRKKKHIFDKQGNLRVGEEVRSEDRGRDFMKGFLAKVKEKAKRDDQGNGGNVWLGSQAVSEPLSSYASAKEELESSCQ